MKNLTLTIKIILLLGFLVLVFFVSNHFAGGDITPESVFSRTEAHDDSESEPHADQDENEETDDDEDASEAGHAEDDDDDDDVPSRVEIHDGLPAVRLSDEVIEKSGIVIAPLQQVSHLEETQSTAQIVDFQPLLASRADYQQIQAERRLAQESRDASSRVYERLRVLHKERANVSLTQVEEARFRLTQDKATLLTAEQKLKNLRLRTRQEWGDVLTNWALGREDDAPATNFFDRLMDQKDVLLLVSLPYGFHLPEETSFIYVNTQPDRSSARKAYLIASAAYADTLIQGETYYFRTTADQLRINMKLSAWIITSDHVEEGFDVPISSVIWYGGQPWVYVKVDDELYTRRPVSNYRETDFGWFIKDTFADNDVVVTKGGQILLSEELRWQIPDEDDD